MCHLHILSLVLVLSLVFLGTLQAPMDRANFPHKGTDPRGLDQIREDHSEKLPALEEVNNFSLRQMVSAKPIDENLIPMYDFIFSLHPDIAALSMEPGSENNLIEQIDALRAAGGTGYDLYRMTAEISQYLGTHLSPEKVKLLKKEWERLHKNRLKRLKYPIYITNSDFKKRKSISQKKYRDRKKAEEQALKQRRTDESVSESIPVSSHFLISNHSSHQEGPAQISNEAHWESLRNWTLPDPPALLGQSSHFEKSMGNVRGPSREVGTSSYCRTQDLATDPIGTGRDDSQYAQTNVSSFQTNHTSSHDGYCPSTLCPSTHWIDSSAQPAIDRRQCMSQNFNIAPTLQSYLYDNSRRSIPLIRPTATSNSQLHQRVVVPAQQHHTSWRFDRANAFSEGSRLDFTAQMLPPHTIEDPQARLQDSDVD